MAEAALELRIHSGLHAGAHAPLPAQDSCTVGADPACDFVLADRDIGSAQLRLVRDGGGAWLQQTAGQPGPQPVAPGRLLPLGPVLVSLAEPDSPWPDAQALAAAATQPAPSPAPAAPQDEDVMAATAAAVPQDDTAAKPAPPEPQPSEAAPALPPAARRLPMAARLALALVLCLATLLGAALWWLSTLKNGTIAPVAASAPLDAGAQRAAIAKVLRDLNLEDRATLSPSPTGGWIVQATALEDETLEALALALSRLDPKPGLHAITGEDARSLVQQALLHLSEAAAGDPAAGDPAAAGAAAGDPAAPSLTVTHLGDGRVRLDGEMADGAARSELLRQLRATLPEWLALDSAITIPEERALRLLADLQAQHLGTIEGRWSASQARLEIVARLEPGSVARWEQALVQTSRRYPNIALNARLEPLPARPAPRLPFRVLTIVNGATDYVVLDDGSKLLLHGRRGGWQLVAVDAGAAVFENGRALRVNVPR